MSFCWGKGVVAGCSWSTMEVIFMEQYREQKRYLHMVFINLEDAYDKIPRNVTWWPFNKHKVLTKYVGLIKF